MPVKRSPNTPRPCPAANLLPALHAPPCTFSKGRGRPWRLGGCQAVVIGQRWREQQGSKHAVGQGKKRQLCPLSCFSAAWSRAFSFSAVLKASLIIFCKFSPHAGQRDITFTSPRCIRVHAGLSMAGGGVHSAPTVSAADKVVVAQSGDGTCW